MVRPGPHYELLSSKQVMPLLVTNEFMEYGLKNKCSAHIFIMLNG